jgi:hypothetical protein
MAVCQVLYKFTSVFITFDYISHTGTYFEIRKLLHNNKTYWQKMILKKRLEDEKRFG